MKRFLFFIFSLIVGAGLFIIVINHIGWEKVLAVFRSFSVWEGLIILAITIADALLEAWRWKIILKSQGYDIATPEIFEYYLSGLTISFLVPMVILGGEIFRCHD